MKTLTLAKIGGAAALPVALALGAALGGGVILLLAHLASTVQFSAALGGKLPWYTTRAAAITAYLLLSATTLLGLTITAKGPNRPFSRATVFALHECLSWLAWAFVGLHVVALLVDRYQPFSLADVLIPFAAPYRTLATGLGVIGLYLIAVLVSSFYVRRWLSQRVWRALHFSSFLLFVLATLHGMGAGSDTTQPWMRITYLASAAGVLALLAYRIARTRATTAQRIAAAPRTLPIEPA